MVGRVLSAGEKMAEFWAMKGYNKRMKAEAGFHRTGDGTRLIIFSSDPAADRVRKYTWFRAWLEENRFKEIALAAHPTEGHESGRTFAVVIDCPTREHLTQAVSKFETTFDLKLATY
ncbi:hypothetical protein [Stratiformator vulcanicus]|uniref:Uncharacterized protein n=1 Tax=Stratiformator vulcanicus TaxID=2527980 RepID=A0A517QXY4_9PLAN|nr:hypothetical protein [Stratiformator vulcanicus]QDT36467.1 hypothetical protein Pan189_08240 [Stratiformator vulcanicus]